jgi:PKD repeat protein
MKRKITPSTFIILMFILIGTASQVKAQCPDININSFSVSTDLVCPNTKVRFNIWTDYQNTISWNLGNEKVSTDRNTTTSYATPGKYYITCLISNTCGNDTLITDSVLVSSTIPYFTLGANPYNADSICPNQKVTFNISGEYKAINWSFDNGHKGTKNEAVERFATLGDHPYTLTLTDFCNNDTTVTGKTVVRMSSEFSGDLDVDVPDSVCSKAKFDFYSNGDMQEILWTFGDGDSLISSQNVIIHDYKTDGNYAVALTATDFCSNKMIIVDTLVVNSSIYPTLPELSKMTDTICPGDIFYVQASAYRVDEYNWNMNDGTHLKGDYISYKYNSAGMHYFTLEASNGCGEVTITDSIYVSSNYNSEIQFYDHQLLNNEACLGDDFTIMSFPSNNMTFILGDGNTVNEEADSIANFSEASTLKIGLTSFNYNALGTYTIHATFTNGCGVKDTIEVGSVDVIDNAPAYAYVSIDFLYSYGGNVAYLNKPTTFYLGTTSNYFIDYGDGSSETFTAGAYDKRNHTYTAEGTYDVSLIATNSCGEADSTGITIKVIKDPKGYANVKESSAETMSVEAYPNPTNDVVTFNFNRDMNENVLFSVYNLQGQLIHQQNITNTNKIDFDFSSYSAGVYVTNFVSDTQNASKRIMLVK